MTDRQFRLGLGATLLACLYYDQLTLASCLVGYLVFEGITNWRLPLVIARLRNQPLESRSEQILVGDVAIRFSFDAERALRLLVASSLIVSLFVLPHALWWLAWFVGFAMLGAGISGVCPMLTVLKMAGFR